MEPLVLPNRQSTSLASSCSSSPSSPAPAPIRSKKGCLTCRFKKVKCDEQRSICGRCLRLRLKCEWNVNGLSAREKLKRQREGSAPKQILPNTRQPESSAVHELSAGLEGGIIGLPSYDGGGPVFSVPVNEGWDTFYQELGFTHDFLDLGNFAQSQGLDYGQSMQLETNLSTMPDNTIMAPPNTATSWPLDFPSSFSISPNLAIQNVELSSTFQLTTCERRALHHYQTTFSLSHTSKNTKWSTYAAMLQVGSQIPMVMHLLTAVSLMDLSMSYNYDLEITTNAIQHFRTGAYMLIDTINSGSEPDHVGVLTSFLFLQMYILRQKEVDLKALIQLSKAVVNHLTRFNLDVRASRSPTSHQSSQSLEVADANLPRDKKELIARLIVWMFYEDVMSCGNGYGGVLARYLFTDRGRVDDIYDHSTSVLESFWGSQYPDSEIIDDVENSTVLRLLFEIVSVHQEVNEWCQSPVPDNLKAENLERNIAALEEKYSNVFRLAMLSITPRNRLLQNADFIVSYFYALRIYHFRCTMTVFEENAPPLILTALSSFLTIAQRTSASASANSHGIHRIQWPLFIAGIETSDGIYREWILSRLSRLRLKDSMERIVQIQQGSGSRASMPLVRKIVCGEGLSAQAAPTSGMLPLGLEGGLLEGFDFMQNFEVAQGVKM